MFADFYNDCEIVLFFDIWFNDIDIQTLMKKLNSIEYNIFCV